MNRIRTISGITLYIVILSIFSIASSASTLDYTLKIYGNTNMDKEINDLDVQYVQDIIAGKADATKFVDANNDGTVDKADYRWD